MFWLTVFILLLNYIALKIYKNVNYWKLKGIKHVKPWPFGSFGRKMFTPKSFVEAINDVYEKYPEAKFIGFHQITNPSLMIKDPEIIKQIKVKNFENFTDHTTIITEDMEPLLGKNIFSLKGQKWKEMRSTLSPAFTSSKMKQMHILIKECAEQFTKHFVELERKGETSELDMLDVFQKYTIDVIATCAFGITCNSLEDETNDFYTTGKKITTFTFLSNLKIIFFVMMPKLMFAIGMRVFPKEVLDFFLNIIKSTMEVREKNNVIRPDMIHLLMEAKKGKLKHEMEKDDDAGFATVEESELGKARPNSQNLTDIDITAQALLFFAAGFDTSSTMMHILAYELATNPEIQKKLQKEIDEVLQNGNIDYKSLLQMKYLDMVICESLRKWPPAPMTERSCTLPFKLIDEDQVLLIEKKESVIIPIFSIHHDEKYFPDPEKFDPERFSDENKQNIQPFTYLPFGAGPRNCIGSRFALLVVKTLIVSILSKFDLVTCERTQIPLKLSKNQFSMKTENGVWLGFKLRSSN